MPHDNARQTTPKPKRAANGVWYVYWSEGRRSKRESLGTKEEAQALQNFAQWILLDVRNKGVGGQPVEYTVAELWQVYDEKHLRKNAASPSTRKYEWKKLEPHFGHLTVEQATQHVMDDYLRKRTAGKYGPAVSEPTVRREVGGLIACMNFCANPPMKMFPAALIEKFNLPDAGQPRDRWLKIEEMQRLVTAAAKLRRPTTAERLAGLPGRMTRGERFLWLALETAARKEAILDLTWDRVDFETNTIHYDVPGRRKTKKQRVAVAISSSLRPILERAYAERINGQVLDNKASVWSIVQNIAIKAGFSEQTVTHGNKPKATGISPHVLRHTAATHMARRGVPLWMIAKILGNSLAMVEKVYAKWAPDNPAGTVDLISGGALEPAE